MIRLLLVLTMILSAGSAVCRAQGWSVDTFCEPLCDLSKTVTDTDEEWGTIKTATFAISRSRGPEFRPGISPPGDACSVTVTYRMTACSLASGQPMINFRLESIDITCLQNPPIPHMDDAGMVARRIVQRLLAPDDPVGIANPGTAYVLLMIPDCWRRLRCLGTPPQIKRDLVYPCQPSSCCVEELLYIDDDICIVPARRQNEYRQHARGFCSDEVSTETGEAARIALFDLICTSGSGIPTSPSSCIPMCIEQEEVIPVWNN